MASRFCDKGFSFVKNMCCQHTLSQRVTCRFALFRLGTSQNAGGLLNQLACCIPHVTAGSQSTDKGLYHAISTSSAGGRADTEISRCLGLITFLVYGGFGRYPMLELYILWLPALGVECSCYPLSFSLLSCWGGVILTTSPPTSFKKGIHI